MARTIGIDIGYDAVRMAVVEHTPDGPSLLDINQQSYARSRRPSSLFSDPEELAQALKTVIPSGSDSAVVLGLRNRFATVMIRQTDKRLKPEQNYEWLLWEAAQFVDEPLNNFILDIGLTGYETGDARDALLVAARREAVDFLKNLAMTAGVEPDAVTVATAAVLNAFQRAYALSDWESAALAHIEPGAIDIVFIRDGHYSLVVMPVDQSAGSQSEGIRMFGAQLRHFINVMPEEDAPDTIYVSSSHSRLPDICSAWGEQLNRRVTPIAPFQNMFLDDALKEKLRHVNPSAYAVAAGLALQVPHA